MNSTIGQVEPGRPGKPGHDNEANCCDNDVNPFAVLTRVAQAQPNVGIEEHALRVASVMISSQDTVGGAGISPPLGVAPNARLFSAAFLEDQPLIDLHQAAALAAQLTSVAALATNMSIGIPADSAQLDGTSTLSMFIDWSTRSQQTLYVVAGTEINKPDPIPTDNYNGITVAASGRVGGVYRKVSALNTNNDNVDAFGDRTSTHILAPGELVDVAGPNGMQPAPLQAGTGTSFAAPHVTGTLALLEQQANTDNGFAPLTRKAVILNSADKIKDIIGGKNCCKKRRGQLVRHKRTMTQLYLWTVKWVSGISMQREPSNRLLPESIHPDSYRTSDGTCSFKMTLLLPIDILSNSMPEITCRQHLYGIARFYLTHKRAKIHILQATRLQIWASLTLIYFSFPLVRG